MVGVTKVTRVASWFPNFGDAEPPSATVFGILIGSL